MCLALPGRVVDLHDSDGVVFGVVDFDGTRREVCFASIPDVSRGEYVIVHVGFAIARIDEQSALETIQMFHDLGLLDDELGRSPDAAQVEAPG